MTSADPYAGSEGLGDIEIPAAAGTLQAAGDWLHRPLTPALSRGTADRGEDLRAPDRLISEWANASVLFVDTDDRVPVTTSDDNESRVRLDFRPARTVADEPPPDAVMIGTVDGTDRWAMPGEVPPQQDETSDGWSRAGGGLRQWGPILGDTDAGLLTTAVAILNWHRSARFCPRCGLQNAPETAGWARRCPNDHQEFPRTDPAVIVVVHDGADRAVLARQPSWPAHRYSILAGFTEAGESLEATVRREMAEEIGVIVSDVRYLGSQPWPFPRSLMVGFAALADPDSDLRPRPGEISDARWVTRSDVRALLADEDAMPDLKLPPGVSIARQLIESWARG